MKNRGHGLSIFLYSPKPIVKVLILRVCLGIQQQVEMFSAQNSQMTREFALSKLKGAVFAPFLYKRTYEINGNCDKIKISLCKKESYYDFWKIH